MTQKFFVRSLSVFALCAGLSLTACGGAAGQDDDQEDANASMAQSSAVEYMITNPINSADPATAATNLQAATQWWPAGCVTRQKDPTNPIVTLTLNNCTGPFGLMKWSGTVTVTFQKNADGTLKASAVSKDMTANGNPATFTMERNITITPGTTTRDVKGTTTWSRVSARGVQVNHTSAWAATIDSSTRCRTVNGAGTTTAGAVTVATTAKDYKVCRPAGID